MFQYHRLGTVPAKHHIALRRETPDAAGCPVYYEHCITRGGFDGPYSILYREHNPGAELRHTLRDDLDTFQAEDPYGPGHQRHHYQTPGAAAKGHLYESLRWIIGNDDVRVGTSEPTQADTGLVQDGDGDLLLFIHKGSGVLDSEMGQLPFKALDYVFIPKGVVHRIRFDDGPVHVMVNEAPAHFVIPKTFLNPAGQAKMDAPYCHRDFRRPEVLSQAEEGDEHVVLHKRGDRWTERVLPHHPFDIVGWDGTVHPWAFNIMDYEPKMGRTHLPPPIHTTFLAGNGQFVVCSFCPRKVDDHPEAIPCPYPHSSVDCDEILWYVEGNFTSRKGVGPGSISHHPMGIPHAPQPGRYEASMGDTETTELAVMIDTYRPLMPTKHAQAHEDASYHGSWAK